MIKISANKNEVHLTSDLHINHKNIIKGLSNWSNGGQRDFNSVDEMNETIIDNINSQVMENHHLFILGDLMFGEKDYNTLFKQINCRNIYVLRGNHCNPTKLIESCIDSDVVYLGWRENVTINNKLYVLSHEPILSWDGMGKESTLLYGHCHASLYNNPLLDFYTGTRTLDVGVDNAYRLFGQYRPFSLEEVTEILDKRPILFIDHHNKNTN